MFTNTVFKTAGGVSNPVNMYEVRFEIFVENKTLDVQSDKKQYQ